ncbi:MAG: argininosuccinate lyase [Bacteroidales bacterium]
MKLWDKGVRVNEQIDRFTVGRDREMDLLLAPFDVLGTLAHITMLESIGLLESDELPLLRRELIAIYAQIERGEFQIEEGIEDVHSQVELQLTRALGHLGKKVHSGRSRNDQVLVDLKMYVRHEIEEMASLLRELANTFLKQSEAYKDVLMPGYTHLQVAMPSSFGLWFGAFAESIADDLTLLHAAWEVANKNPLGSAAGYGSSFPLNRTLTTRLLGFDDLSYNVVYAQMGRGKTEKVLSFALSSMAATFSKFAMDACLYLCQNYAFISLPDELTTGSSIMPHKKNPDVFELIRAKSNRLQALPSEITLLLANLPTGYFRDLQLLKEILFPAIEETKQVITMLNFMVGNLIINRDILNDERYKYLFSVEVLNQKVLSGTPFRDAYKEVGQEIASGSYAPEKRVCHSHEGSIGNLCNEKIESRLANLLASFNFSAVHEALLALRLPTP